VSSACCIPGSSVFLYVQNSIISKIEELQGK
jgi:hypothetical protein